MYRFASKLASSLASSTSKNKNLVCNGALLRRNYVTKDINFGVGARAAMLQGVSEVAEAVKVTMGPKGRNVIIEKSNRNPRVTKDGVTVAKSIKFKDKAKNLGADLIKQVAKATNSTAGDGTTCATVLTQAILIEGCKSVAAGVNVMDLRNGINKAVDVVITDLKSRAVMISTPEEITQVGTISANGERDIGELIARAMEKVGKEGVITVADGNTVDNELEVVEGMKLSRGYISPYFITDQKTQKCELENPFILIHDKKISDMGSLLKVLELSVTNKRPLLVVAEDVDSDALAMLILNKHHAGLKVCAIKAPGFGDNRRASLDDLAILTGGEVITEERGIPLDKVRPEMLGTAKKITVSIDDTIVLHGGGDKKFIEERCVQLRDAMHNSSATFDKEKAQERLSKLSGGQDGGLDCLPDVLVELVKTDHDSRSALSALGGALYYLKQAFLDEQLLRFAQFELLPCSVFSGLASKPYMVLDAVALENLEIFENSRNGESSGTLYAQLNQCVTAFGKRLLKSWLARPLYHVESIKERQEAVAGLKGVNLPHTLEFRKALSKLPDMERLLARVLSSRDASGRNANKVVLYEDSSKKQLQEFISALRGLELMAQACLSLGVILNNVKSRQLSHLLTPGKGLPDVSMDLNHFKDAFDWVEANNSGRIIPHEGVDKEYDSAGKAVNDIESSLLDHLKEQRKLLGSTSISYVGIGKDTYLLEVPENLSQNIPQDYERRSSKKGFVRYWTPDIKIFLKELSHAESERETLLKSTFQRMIERFCEHHTQWKQLVSATAELDVLINLAIANDYYEGPTCRPSFVGTLCTNEAPYIYAKSLGHPVLRSDTLGKSAFVPNDITIGGPDQASFILLTGPNMGGKSTLLRQVCLAVILAQVGADVPSESFELSPVDRIFVRMGARDNIMAGQSTFLTELSETATMLSSATRNSLVALDELGRGTSTSDGQAIAESVLEHLVRSVQCRGLFSTHYHRLAIDYLKDPKVCLAHMACQVGSGNEGLDEVTFLYRLSAGACPKSYGVNVARLAGLPTSVLQKADAKSREFEATYGKYRTEPNSSNQSWVDEIIVLVRKLNNAANNLSCEEMVSDHSIVKLQHEARELLERC